MRMSPVKFALAGASAALMLASTANAAHVHFRHFGKVPTTLQAQYCVKDGASADDGGCDILAANGQIGLYTTTIVNGAGLFDYARQSGQAAYPVGHPPFNIAGEDYPVGSYSIPTLDPTQYNWASVADATCSYKPTLDYVRCDMANYTFVGSVSGGVLTYISGTVPIVGQFIYSGTYGSVYAPYQITASLGGGQYQLAAKPDLYTGAYVGGIFVQQTTPPNVAAQTFNSSRKITIAGFNFVDVGMYIDGYGYLDIHNNNFSEGQTYCRYYSGTAFIGAQHAINSPVKFYSNYANMAPTCSNSANLYPGPGGGVTQATFSGTISGGTTLTVGTVASGTIYIGQYIAGPGFTTSQVGANPSAGVYTLSNAEPNGTYATMTTGPVLGRDGVVIGIPTGSALTDAEYNFSDKVGYLMTANTGGAVVMKHNFIDVVGGPTGHTSPFLQEAQFNPAPPQSVSFVGNVSGSTITVTSGTVPSLTGQAVTPWLVSTANNAIDHTFTTATVLSVSGLGAGATITLDTSEPTQSGVTFYSAPLYVIPYEIQSDNVVINNGYSSAGCVYGWAYAGSAYLPGNTPCAGAVNTNLFNQGSGTSEDSFFSTSGYGNQPPGPFVGYYVQYTYNESANNVIIANSSANNYASVAGSRNVNTSAIVRFLSQGTNWGSNVGAFPGAIATAIIANNYIDPKGSQACFVVTTPGVYTGPANGVVLSPIYSGNVDLIDGSTADASHCYVYNNP